MVGCISCTTNGGPFGDGNTCNTCDPVDYFLIPEKTACREACQTWEYREVTAPYDCMDCIQGCDTCTDGTTCVTCASDFDKVTGDTCKVKCDSDEYRDAAAPYDCKDCMTGCVSCTTGTTCDTCHADYFLEPTSETCVEICESD